MTQNEYREKIDAALAGRLAVDDSLPVKGLAEAMRYSLLAGGKRIRPMLVLEFCRIAGGNIDLAMPVACGIEMLHTYSLIHDDLPCMDNDELRRGRPTNHMVYGECTATLAGDALQAEAFASILHADLPASRRVLCAECLADAVGLDGMCGGQYLDMIGEGKVLTEAELNDIITRKTGDLLIDADLGVEGLLGQNLVASLQSELCLDMLDVLSTVEALGKPIGSDAAEQKNTFMALLGEEECRRRVKTLTDEAKNILQSSFDDTAFLCELADTLAGRMN